MSLFQAFYIVIGYFLKHYIFQSAKQNPRSACSKKENYMSTNCVETSKIRQTSREALPKRFFESVPRTLVNEMEASARLAAACFAADTAAAASEAEAVKRSRSEPTSAFLQHQTTALLHHEDINDEDLGPLKVFGPSCRAREKLSRYVDGPDVARGFDVVLHHASAVVECAGQENCSEDEECDKDLRGKV